MENAGFEAAEMRLPQSADKEHVVSEQDSSPPRGNPFPIVGIGASAGGLEAFCDLLRNVPAQTGMAFVLVQHLDPQHTSLLADIVAQSTGMPVHTVEDGIEVARDNVYVIPPNTSMVLEGSALRLAKRESGLHLPIDIFFRSLAAVQGSRAIGVVLSGNASDGSVGLQAIKSECGLTFAQDDRSARFSGMPRNAAATGTVDHILSPQEIGRELSRLAGHPFLIPSTPGQAESETLPEGHAEFTRIFAILANATRVDFAHYKPTTVRRRIGRRMMVLGLPTLKEYSRYLEQQPTEIRELYRDLLISVTNFFRDPEAFQSLADILSGALVATSGSRSDPIRIWVPGCATGEEVYSLAICVTELLEKRELSAHLQLFGTDLSEPALDRARQGIYSEIVAEHVSPERLKRFFTKVESGFQIAKGIRETCIFARHDLTKDPPFSRIDVLSCRNVLIYLDAPAQRRVLPVFHYALKPGGFLLLGTAETAGAGSELFAPVDKSTSIYRRRSGPGRLPAEISGHQYAAQTSSWEAALPSPASPTDLYRKLDRVIQAKYSPDAVLVDNDFQILQFRGHTSPYLDPTPGDASLNLLRLAQESLVMPLRRALEAAADSDRPVEERGTIFDRDGNREEVIIDVTPLTGDIPGERFWIVVFRRSDRTVCATTPNPRVPLTDDGHGARLEREITELREYMRNLREDYEAHAEELQAANEEARSANEELQSANEELGTTKEELQSSNEELTTVNEELQNRNKELSAINSDLKNVLAAVNAAVIMVDSDLRIRRFNPVAEKLLALTPLDVGRPIGHLRGSIFPPDFELRIQSVIDTLHAREHDLQDAEGRWYSTTVRPYRTTDDRIVGAVITVQDIDQLKRGLAAAEDARDYAEGMIETVREPLVVLDSDLRVLRATSAFFDTFLVSRDETEGRFLYDLGNGQWNRPRLRELIGAALFRSQPFQDYEVEHDFPHIGLRTMRLNGRRIATDHRCEVTLLLAIEDVTARQEAAETRFRRLFETAKDGIVVVDMETEEISDVNAYLLDCIGHGREEMVGRKLQDVPGFAGSPELATLISDLRAHPTRRLEDLPFRKRDGKRLSMELVANTYQVGTQRVAQLNLRDITVRKEQEDDLKRSLEEKAVLVREVHHRVKNNLQVIVSLLSLQASYTKDPKSIAAFEEAEGRVRAIAHIHENLYATPDLAQIEFSAYLTSLVRELITLHSTIPNGVALDIEAEEMVLEMEQAIPLGLIANELIINSLKHGIRDGRGGLRVALTYMRNRHQPVDTPLDEGWGQLQVSDNGPGLPQNLNIKQAQSMGFKLLNLLVKQLRGRVVFSNSPGATICIEFPLAYR